MANLEKTFVMKMTEEMHVRIQEEANKHGISMAEYVRSIMRTQFRFLDTNTIEVPTKYDSKGRATTPAIAMSGGGGGGGGAGLKVFTVDLGGNVTQNYPKKSVRKVKIRKRRRG